MFGGIDLGGTKIEARLFDSQMQEVDRKRIATPTESYDALLEALLDQIRWLETKGDVTAIGLGTPGLIHPETGTMLTANLPSSGQRPTHDLERLSNRPIALINDCRAFTLSEATLGAGQGMANVVGLVIGTGVAGGHVTHGQLLSDANGQHAEYGHLPLPAVWVEQTKAPLIPCGCGLSGCFETYLAGPGLVKLARHITGQAASTHDILSDPTFNTTRTAWLDLTAHLVALIARTADPDMIVLGGGLGMIDGLPKMILDNMAGKLLAQTKPPVLRQAAHGDASGALGAALYAKTQEEAAG